MRLDPRLYPALTGLALMALVGRPVSATPTELGLYTQSSSTASLQIGAQTNANTVTNQNTTLSPNSLTTSYYLADLPNAPDTTEAGSNASVFLTNPTTGVARLQSFADVDLSTLGAVGASHTGGFTAQPLNEAFYAFTDPRPFKVTFTYDDTQVGSEALEFGPYINSQGGGVIGPGTLPANGSGSFSELFPAGFLQIEFYDDVYSADALEASAPATLSSSTKYTLAFSITDVPEPATWSLMFAGFAIVGAGLRRRSSGSAVASARP